MRSRFGLIVGLQRRFGNERFPEVPDLFVHGAVGAVQHVAAELDSAARIGVLRSLLRFLI